MLMLRIDSSVPFSALCLTPGPRKSWVQPTRISHTGWRLVGRVENLHRSGATGALVEAKTESLDQLGNRVP